MYLKRSMASFLLVAISVGCSNSGIGMMDVTGPETWGGSDNVRHLGHLYISEQPDAEALRVASANGVNTVIDMRHPSETDWNEKKAAESAGLEYINIPIDRRSNTFDKATIERINLTVDEHDGEKILLHCASGNRTSGWLAIYLAEKRALTVTEALAVAEKAGPMSEGTRQRVLTYLGER